MTLCLARRTPHMHMIQRLTRGIPVSSQKLRACRHGRNAGQAIHGLMPSCVSCMSGAGCTTSHVTVWCASVCSAFSVKDRGFGACRCLAAANTDTQGLLCPITSCVYTARPVLKKLQSCMSVSGSRQVFPKVSVALMMMPLVSWRVILSKSVVYTKSALCSRLHLQQ